MRKLVLGALLIATIALQLPASAGTNEGSGKSIRIVDLNLLHGVFCERESKGCQAHDRVALLARQLEDSDCPEVVGLQEINRVLAKELKRAQKTMCDGKYKTAFSRPPRGVDTERVF